MVLFRPLFHPHLTLYLRGFDSKCANSSVFPLWLLLSFENLVVRLKLAIGVHDMSNEA